MLAFGKYPRWSFNAKTNTISYMYIRVRVATSAKKESCESNAKDSFLVSVKEPAEQNLANKRVLELIGAYFGVNHKQIRIISGHHSPGKILSIPDVK